MQDIPRHKQILYCLIIVVVFFLCLELSAYSYDFLKNQLSQPDQVTIRNEYAAGNYTEYDPYLMVRLKSNYKSNSFSINSLGFRGREFSVDKPNSTYRIVLIGGSSAFGVGASSDNNTIPAYLEKKLNSVVSENYHIEVINGGVTGYFSTQELILLHNKILDINPDTVIIYDGRNDVYFMIYSSWAPHVTPYYIELEEWANNPPSGKIINDLLIKSNFIRKIKYVYKHATKTSGYFSSIKPELNYEGITVYENNLHKMVSLLQGEGVTPVLIFQPSIFYGNKNLSNEEINVLDRLNNNTNQELGFLQMEQLYPRAIFSMKKVADEKNVTMSDFTSVFDEYQDTVYIDDVHYNDKGNEIVAESIFNLIYPQLKNEGVCN